MRRRIRPNTVGEEALVVEVTGRVDGWIWEEGEE
jgi:hypothetical protein